MSKKKTTEEFIEEAKLVHGDKYEYTKVSYIKSNEKVEITCEKHGSFFQSPSKHLFGRGCKKCAGEKTALRMKLTDEEFIEKAKEAHGDKYNYSKVAYINNSTNVIIGCEIHGDFEQQPNNHIGGNICPKCSKLSFSKERTRSKEKFITKCKELHGEEYDYSITEYTNCKDKIKLICKTHGVFELIADNHQRKDGCPTCKNEKRLQVNKENFIKQSIELHGDIYDYSLVDYINNTIKIKIICSKHGVFEQLPSSHSQGNGCTDCGKEKRESRKLTTEDFIKRAKETHGDRYNYSISKYVNADTPVDIECIIHGKFTQNPFHHINGSNCKKCNMDKKSKDYRSNTEDFIEKAIIKHEDTYDYSLVEYSHCRIPVKIVCPVHGVFEQKPTTHLLGKGCKQCGNLINVYKREDYIKLSEKATLYLIRVYKEDEIFYKIGKTKNTVKQRFSSTNIQPYEYEIIHEYTSETGKIFDLEIELHKKYFKYKYNPFHKFSGYGECYRMELPIEEIISL